MRHLNTKSLRVRLDAADHREDELPEHDIAIQQVRRDAALIWAPHRTAIIALCKAQGSTEDAWCKANLGKALRTMQGYLQLAKAWPTYVKKRRKLGNCGRYGIEFALELIAKPREETETKRGGSATGNRKGTNYRNGPKKQDYRTPPPAFRYLDGIFRYDHDGCAKNKKVALCTSFSSDLLHDDVHGRRMFCNGEFGMNAQLAAYFPHCGAQHVTWLTLASVNSRWFHGEVLPFAKHILFPSRRIRFQGQDNVLNSDLMLVLYGDVPRDLQSNLTYTIPCSGVVLP